MSTKTTSNLICFDTETTGLVSYYESLIEISAIRFNLNGEIEDKFTSLLDPMKEVTQNITDLTGITNEDLKGAPSFWEVFDKFADFIKSDDILFAHNASFDVGFVGVWMSKVMDILPSNRIYDTIAIAKHSFPNLKSYKLVELIRELELEGENAHRAEADVLATISLIRKCFEKENLLEESVKTFLAKNFRHFTFRQHSIKPINTKNDAIKIVYNAIRGNKNLKIKYNYSPLGNIRNKIYEDIELQPLSIFQYKDEIYLEGFSEGETYFRRIDLKRIEEINLIQRNQSFIKPITKKKESFPEFSQEANINKYYRDILSIEQTSKIIPKYAILNTSSVCEALIRDYTSSFVTTGREDFSTLITIVSRNKIVNDTFITFLDKIRSAGSFVRINPINAVFTQDEVDYFLEGAYELIQAITKDEIPNRKDILYYATKEDYEKRLMDLKSENDKTIKSLSDQLIKLNEQLNLAEEIDELTNIEDLRRENARLEEELDVAVSVAEVLEDKLYIIQEEMEKLKTEHLISKSIDSEKLKQRPVNFDTIDIERAIVLANQGLQNIVSSTTGKEYEAVKLIILMENGETSTAIVRGIWSQTAIHLKRNDKVNFINVFAPNWKEARIFHVFDKYVNSNIDYPVSYIVIEPDLLYQATDISSSALKNDIYCTNIYLMNNQFNDNKLTPPMLKGILVNAMIDEYLISEGEFNFEKEINRIIETRKLEFAYTSQETFDEIIVELKSHYENIGNLFPKSDKNHFPNIFEPYLISSKFGIEGRLDLCYVESIVEDSALLTSADNKNINSKLLQDTKITNNNAIYEIKSGYPHTEHSYQLIAYSLAYLSCYYQYPRTIKLIYTNGKQKEQLKDPFIPSSKGNKAIDNTQLVINLRNHLALITLMEGSTEDRTCPEIPTYMKDEILCSNCKFKKQNCLNQRDLFMSISDEDELFYYKGFMKLVYKNELLDRFTASLLWDLSTDEKKEKFGVITNLKIIKKNEQEIELLIKDKNTSDFKIGDSAFLHRNNITNGFLFKCTLLDIKGNKIKVLLNKAHISNISGIEDNWILDKSSYLTGSQKERTGLFKFLTSHIDKNDDERLKKLLLGKINPEFSNDIENNQIKYADISKLNENQIITIQRAIETKDYLLVQGPPGTGKSYTLATLIFELVNRGEKILLTGFTNRSVDNALLILKNELKYDKFVRIGSYYSIDNNIKPYSTEAIARKHSLNNLFDIKKEIDNIPIIASTAFSADHFIIENSTFDTVIVDESSQMTEPATLLVISKGKKFILFGDHKQLPPVVNTEQLESAKFPKNNLELKSLNQSLFERLIRINEKQKTQKESKAIVMLNVQYRMNTEIATFPNIQFYNGELISAPDNAERILEADLKKISSDHKDLLHPKRAVIFLNTKSKIISKENYEEAKIVKRIIEELIKGDIPKNEIGIITPYKAQCALIRRELEKVNIKTNEISNEGEIIVDTVERYQGGHKEVIIVSFTVSDNNMMNFLTENNDDTNLNRRLNVAITRARSKLILIGNKYILSQDKVYRNLINYLEDKNCIFDYKTEKQLELDLIL